MKTIAIILLLTGTALATSVIPIDSKTCKVVHNNLTVETMTYAQALNSTDTDVKIAAESSLKWVMLNKNQGNVGH
jgi:hypothetical protein